jgi:imidazolonepropionase-like amidohydrolase
MSAPTTPPAPAAPQPPRLLDLVRQRARDRLGQDGPAERYAHWTRSFVLFHNKRHPRELQPGDVFRFLDHVAHTEKDPLNALEEAHTALTFLDQDVLALDVMAEEAHRRGRLCSVHARSAQSCKMAARAGVDLIDHATFIDDETLDVIAECGAFVAPGLDYIVSTLEYARQGGFPWLGSYQNFLDQTHYEEELEAAVENIAKAHRRGIKILIGSDFGFHWCPHGTYGREFTHLVKLEHQ